MKARRSDKQRSAAFEKFNNRARVEHLHVETISAKRNIFKMIADKFKRTTNK